MALPAVPAWYAAWYAGPRQAEEDVMATADTATGSQFFYEVDDDLESHEEHLRLAYHLGKTFLATQRA